MKKTKCWHRLFSFVLALALVVSSGAFAGFAKEASAKAKAPKLSAKSVKVQAGSSKKVTVKNAPKGAKVTWSSKNKKIAKVKNGKITGVKKGSTKVIAKVVYKQKKKKVTKKLTVKVTVTAKSSAAPTTDPKAELKGLINQSNVGEEHKSASGLTTKDNGLMRRELTSLNLIDYAMGIGWNLGNQLEESNFKGLHTTVEQCETNAGNPVATQTTFDGLKAYGVNTVRIPVAWSNLMSTDGTYTINKDLLDRVETVVNYALNNEMYVIINEHWDGGWWGMIGSPDEKVREEGWKKWRAIWMQVSDRFKEYSDHLIFEAQNEELSSAFPTTGNWGLNTRVGADGFFDATGEYPTGSLSEDEIYETAYKMSQEFVNIVRESGGNNAYRHLLIPGNTTAINKACDERFKMPSDIAENGNDKLSVDVHIYEPNGYALSAASTDEGYRSSWGGAEDEKYLRDLMGKMKKFTDQGYGIIAGECGVVKADKDNIPDWMKYFFGLCKEMSFTPCLWDEGHYYNREGGYFNYKDYGACIAEWAGKTVPPLPEGVQESNLQTTGVCIVPTVENKNPKVVYTWEGTFMRHAYHLDKSKWDDPDIVWLSENADGTDCEAGIGRTDNISEGMRAIFDQPAFWNVTMTCDWSTIEKPCIRVYPKDDVISKGADLQLAYMKDKNGGPGGGQKKAADYTGNWLGEYIELDKDLVTSTHPWIWITTNTFTGAIYEKVEICDAAYNADGTAYQK